MKKILISCIAAFMLSCVAMAAPAYAGTITDQNGGTYTYLDQAIQSVPEGGEATFYIDGEVKVKNNSTSTSQTYTVLERNATVTILAKSSNATIIGGVVCDNESAKLVLGCNDTQNKLHIDGYVGIDSGTLETHRELSVTCNVYAGPNGALCVGYYSSTEKALVSIEGGTFTHNRTSALYVAGQNTQVEFIKDASFNGEGSSNAAVNIGYRATVKRIENIDISGGRYGMQIDYGGVVEEIVDTDELVEHEIKGVGAAIAMQWGHADAITRIGSISNYKLTSTESGSSDLASTIYFDRSTQGTLEIGTIDSCTITSNGAGNTTACIQMLGWSGRKPLKIGTIKNSTLTANNGGSGFYLQFGAEIGSLENNTVSVNVQNASKNGKALYLYCPSPSEFTTRIGQIVGGTYVDYSTVKNNGCLYLMGGNVEVDTIKDAAITSTNGYAIHNATKGIKLIEDCTIVSEGEAGRGIYSTTAISEIKDCQKISAKYGIFSSKSIGKINNCTFTSDIVSSIGIYTTGSIGEINNADITAANGIVSSGSAGEIGKIEGGQIDASAYGIVAQSSSSIGSIDEVTIASKDAGIYTHKGTIGSLANNKVTSETDALRAQTDGIIGSISSGSYIGANNAIKTWLETSSGISAGQVNIVSGNPVFKGVRGYAIDNAHFTNETKLEPDLDTELHGDARYLGALGLIANDGGITYPTFTATGQPYRMSSSTVPADGFGTDRFHYLTVECKVSYDANGGEGPDPVTYDGEWRADLAAEKNTYSLAKHTFAGWNTRSDGSGTPYAPGDIINIDESEIVLYAQWRQIYTVTVNVEGEGDASASPTSGSTGTNVVLNASPREGWEFDEWQLVSGGVAIENNAFAIGASDVVINAIFKQIMHTVSFDAAGGTEVKAQEVAHGKPATVPAEPTRDEHTFGGWYLGDAPYDFSAPVLSDLKLVARWTANTPAPPTQVTITYELNGGVYAGSTQAIVEAYDIGAEVTIHEAPTRAGYRFAYWRGSELYPGDKITLTQNRTLVAQWKKNSDPQPKPKPQSKPNPAPETPATGDPTGASAAPALAAIACIAFSGICNRITRASARKER